MTVTCTHTGYRTATATSTLRALKPVSDVTVDADAEGSCVRFTDPLDAGVDKKYTCTMTRGDEMILGAEATGPSSQMTLGWAAAIGVRAIPALGDLDVSVVGGAVVFTQAGTATVRCTADGDITLTVSIGGVAQHTTKIAVDCDPPVVITNYTAGTRNGPGAMSGTFDVAPATARCTARRVGGFTAAGDPVPGGTGTNRTVSVTTTATGWLDVEVECSNAGHATSTATARFRADDDAACATELGTLGHGTRVESGTLAQGTPRLRCTSFRRDAENADLTYYAHRYTFTMATAGWVSVDLDATGSLLSAIDPYLVVLYGHGSGGVERARDDNSGVSDNAQLTSLFLAPGKYTIEATTASAIDTGPYRLSIDADFDVRAPEQPSRVDARVGQSIARTWAYLPTGATATVQSVTPTGLTAAVTSDRGNAALTATSTHAGDYTVTVAYTASGHTSTVSTMVKILCPPRHVTTTSRTCTPLASTLPSGCAVTPLNTDGYWGANSVVERYSAYSTKAPAACRSLSELGAASYFSFTVPDRPGRLPVRVAVDSAEPRNAPTAVHFDGGQPSLTIWKKNPSSLSFKAHATTHGPDGLFAETTLGPGQYIVELAPSQRVSRPNDRYSVTAIIPTGRRQYDETQRLGHIGSVSSQLTLAEFVRTRAQDHADYPYLTWTSDQCSSSPDEATYNTLGLAWIDVGLPRRKVPIYHACWRHDFNWRNLTRIQHHVNPRIESWTEDTKEQADERIELDIRELCERILHGSDWVVARFSCYLDAATYRLVVGKAVLYSVAPINSDIGAPERVE